MPHFSFIHDMHVMDGVDLIGDYRFSGTYQDDEEYIFDTVEVPGRGLGLSWDGWRTINRLHPLHRAVDAYLATQDAAEQAQKVIRAEMAENRMVRRTVPIIAVIDDVDTPPLQTAAE